MTWTCHVCGRRRDDADISVYSSTKLIGTIPMQQNVRHCNDDVECIQGARSINFLPEKVVETSERVGDGTPDLVTRFRFRADRFARKRNAQRIIPSYRYEVVRENGRWAVVAMQNLAAA